MSINESVIEAEVLSWFDGLGYQYKYGPDLALGEPNAERDSFKDVVLKGRLKAAIDQLNPGIPAEARDEAFRKVLRIGSPSLNQTNRAFHIMLRDGVEVEYRRKDGSIAGDRVVLADFENPDRNDWLVANQFTVIEGQNNRRPDIVVFLNGLPLAIIELKNATDENATIWSAFNQLQTYKSEIGGLFYFNELMVISDGMQARVGSLTASSEWFKVWRTIDGEGVAPQSVLELDVLIHGVFEKRRFLNLLQHFIVYEDDTESQRINKIIAGYHQFHAVNAAVEETVRASGMIPAKTGTALGEEAGRYWSGKQREGKTGDRRVGVVWHTQGSGKSFTMLFFASRIIRHPAMQNPTLVVLTDRNDLDDQLFGQFQRCYEILRQKPVQADSVEHLKTLLKVASGGVVFTTIQKFAADGRMPVLSDRKNIVVIADEAHRSQYDLIDGLARNMRDALPNASFIGFTGTPIEKEDANTRAVFGDYISIYDIQRAVADGATVPIYYESRIAKLALNEAEVPRLDSEFEELTEGEETMDKERLKTKWAALEALVGNEKRIALIAADLIQHYERRSEAMDGKAMVVCMSRRICVELYKALTTLRPEWASAPDDEIETERKKSCVVKIVMTGGAEDGPEWQQHVRSKQRRRDLARRFKDSKDPFRIVIVRDMWLTGFDAPCLATMYADKPMRGHGLMQAIARVNRVFKDKPGGLVVDYLGLADQLRQALRTYTESGGQGNPSINTAEAVGAMQDKYETICGMLHGFDWSIWETGTPPQKLALLPAAQEHILKLERGKERFCPTVTDLSKAFALCAASDEALGIRDDIAFFQVLRSILMKSSAKGGGKTAEELDHAVRQLVAKAIAPEGQVIDVFTAAGLKRPDISILSEQFLNEVRALKYKNVAAELLIKLLKDEIRELSTKNSVQGRAFTEMLKKTLNSYHNRAISTQEIIGELIQLAKQLDERRNLGQKLGLNDDEVAFYEALATNDSARKVMGDDQLKVIAIELVTQVRKNVTIDWTLRESARAKIKVIVKRILRKYGYPPDLQDQATLEVLAQAELVCADFTTFNY